MLLQSKESGPPISTDEILDHLARVSKSLGTTSKKLSQSVKFIDYFVHDILDFAIIRKDESKFTKDVKLFDLREAINEIMEIQEDKVEMKCIAVETIFKNF